MGLCLYIPSFNFIIILISCSGTYKSHRIPNENTTFSGRVAQSHSLITSINRSCLESPKKFFLISHSRFLWTKFHFVWDWDSKVFLFVFETFNFRTLWQTILHTRGSQPLGRVPVPGLEEGPSGTRKVTKLVYLSQFWCHMGPKIYIKHDAGT